MASLAEGLRETALAIQLQLSVGPTDSGRLMEAADRLERHERELAEARFAPLGDNHHNAAACPYCSPRMATHGR